MPTACQPVYRSQPTGASALANQSNSATAGFFPKPIEDWYQTELPETMLDALVSKYLLTVGERTGRAIAAALCAPPKAVLNILQVLKNNQLVYYKDTATMGDFTYALSDAGRERARKFLEDSMYVGAVPVSLPYYVESVKHQSISCESPSPMMIRDAFCDMLLPDEMLDRLGPAINSGRGLFLYGYPGNGKTSIAERISRSFNSDIWIPRAIFVEGEIIKFYDPQAHESVEQKEGEALRPGEDFDSRWIKAQRPTIIVGGELTMEALELQFNHHTRITEPSVQLKSNCGVLVIDDFGRQRMEPAELLNRWIVPLEKRYDFLTLSTGTKIQVPFDQLIIFSTNLEPKELVDDAFLRRIPYKLNVDDPSEDQFRNLMKMFSKQYRLEFNEDAVNHLIRTHYQSVRRPFRCCHARDLLLQIVHRASYLGEQPSISIEALDAAVGNYFAVL